MLHFFKSKTDGTILMEMGKPTALYNNSDLELLQVNSVDASTEKHVPVVTIEDGMVVVRIGSQPHPMLEEHYIEWVMVQTSGGGTFYNLAPGEVPEAIFPIKPGEVEEVFIYCNLHGLWKAPTPIFTDLFEDNTVACSAEFTAGCVDPSND